MMSGDLLQKSTVVVYNFTGNDALQAELINNIMEARIEGLSITMSDGYTDMSSLWLQFCQELADKNNEGDLPNGAVLPLSSKEAKRHSSSQATGRMKRASS
jgi:hypothetical protein